MRGVRRILAAAAASSLCLGSFASAQFGRNSLEARLARPDSFDGQFHYCRAVYRPNPRGDGGSWLTDYPLADIDLSIRLSELTKTRVSIDSAGQPNHLIVQLTSEELLQCPVIIMQEVGRLLFTREDAVALRTYLGARGRGSGILPAVLGGWLPRRHQRAVVRHDALRRRA